MTFGRPYRYARELRIVVIAIGVVVAASSCRPASQDEAASAGQPATASNATSTTPSAGVVAPAAVSNVALHELDENAHSTPLSISGMCSLDKLNDGLLVADQVSMVASPREAVVSGWVGEDAIKAWPKQAPSLRFDQVSGVRAWEAGLGAPLSRKDVAKHFHADSMEMTGFKVPVDLSSLPTGDYSIRVVYDRAGHRMACDQHKRIHIGS